MAEVRADIVMHLAPSATSYYLADGLGSTVATVDGTGAVQGTYSYDVFGAVRGSTGSVANEYQFAGQQTDPSGLQYLRARYYDPAVGRFISRDPYVNGSAGRPLFRDPGLIGSALNRYAYAAGNPVLLGDPMGYGCGWFSGVCNYLQKAFTGQYASPGDILTCGAGLVGGQVAVYSILFTPLYPELVPAIALGAALACGTMYVP